MRQLRNIPYWAIFTIVVQVNCRMNYIRELADFAKEKRHLAIVDGGRDAAEYCDVGFVVIFQLFVIQGHLFPLERCHSTEYNYI